MQEMAKLKKMEPRKGWGAGLSRKIKQGENGAEDKKKKTWGERKKKGNALWTKKEGEREVAESS